MVNFFWSSLGMFLIYASFTAIFFLYVHWLRVGEYQPWPVSMGKSLGYAALVLALSFALAGGMALLGGKPAPLPESTHEKGPAKWAISLSS